LVRFKKVAVLTLSLALLALSAPPSTASGEASVTVMSRNIYLGADVGKALELIPNLPAAAQYMWDQVNKTDFSKRAKILANEINQSSPDVIGIQEATIWYCQKYPWSKKVEVFNFTEQLLAELKGEYQLATKDGKVALNPGFSINPIPFLTKVKDEVRFQKIFGSDTASCGFETGDGLLIKRTPRLELIQLGTTEYEVNYPIVPTIMTVYRGYSWADIKVDQVPTRFVTTHLESLWDENVIPNSAKQAKQLIDDLSNTKMPIIVMGDFNADPRDPRPKNTPNPGEQPVASDNCPAQGKSCNAYKEMIDAGFADVGPDSQDPNNYTWGMNALLTGADPKRLPAALLMGNKEGFTDRLDYIFTKNGAQSKASKIIGTQPEYGSDHAGVVASISLVNQSNEISPPLAPHAPFPISFWQWVLITLILIISYIFWRRKKREIKLNP
jgi:endonuclease/exonuclease/phosphatase family metal-dependent hydrolase